MDELEASVARAIEEIRRLKAENAGLSERLRALGKETDELGALISGLGTAQKLDSRTKKRLGQKLKSMAEKAG